jgi:hypothetical protein
MPVTYQDVLEAREELKIMVPMNQVAIAFWPPATAVQYLATGGLNACTGIAVVSLEAGILAHVSPLPIGSTPQSVQQNTHATLQNAQIALNAIRNLYQANQAKFATSQTYVVAGIRNNYPAMPDVIHLVNRFFGSLGLRVSWKEYGVVMRGPRPLGWTSIVIHAERQGAMPAVYLNDGRVN